MSKNAKKTQINPKSLANLGPPFDGSKPGPGRPRLPESVKAERKEAREILRDAAPAMAARIAKIALTTMDDDVAIRACRVGLDKILPNLEEVETMDSRPLIQLTDEQINAKLAELNASAPRTDLGDGTAEK